jgi:hypothetical protein
LEDQNRYAKVDNYPGYKRDLETGAILINDEEALIKSRQILKKKRKEKQELAKLKDDVAEIKELLSTLLNKIGD